MSSHPPRTYGFWTGTFVVAASMVGSGILMTPGQTLVATQSPSALFLLWTLGGVMALCGALTVAELGASLPHAGGDYVFVREAFGSAWAFVFGWCCLMFTFAGPIALIAVLTVQYVAPPSFPSSGTIGYLIATAIIIVFTVLHSIGQRQSAWVQNLTTSIKLGIFVLFALVGFFSGGGDFGNFSSGLAVGAKGGLSILAINLTYALYSYSGWNGAAYLAGEIREPEKNLPRSLIFGSLLVTALYLMMNALYVYAISPAEFGALTTEEARVVAWRTGERLFGGNVSRILSIVFGVGMLATISALLFTGPRIAYMMARDGLMPSAMGWLDPRGNTPLFATMLQAALAVGLLWSGSFEKVLDFTSIGLTALCGLTVASIFPLRMRADWPAKYRTPFYPIPPIVFLVMTGFTVVLATYGAPDTGGLSILSILLGFPLYYLYRWLAGHRPLEGQQPVSAVDSAMPEN